MRVIVLALLLSWFSCGANSKKEDASRAKEIIDIAQNLILQKDRVQAVRILYKAQVGEKNKVVATEIRGILKDIGSLFLYDKAQQEYESSINFKKTDPGKWLGAVERAQKIEPDNTLVLIELIRNQLNKKNLEKAKELLEEFRSKNPFDKNVILAATMLALASGDVKETLITKMKLKDTQLANQNAVNAYVELLERVILGNKEKALQALAVLKKEDAQNPQISFWENRIQGKQKADEDVLCGTIPEHLYRRYYYDLFFCSPALEHFFKFQDDSTL